MINTMRTCPHFLAYSNIHRIESVTLRVYANLLMRPSSSKRILRVRVVVSHRGVAGPCVPLAAVGGRCTISVRGIP